MTESEANPQEPKAEKIGFLDSLRLAFSQPRLSAMMFLEYAVWGAWYTVLALYLNDHLGFTGAQISWIYAMLPLAMLIAPFTGGQIADRYLSGEKTLAFFHLGGAALLVGLAFVKSMPPMLGLMLLYTLLFAPTLALTNAVAFRNLRNAERDFGPIRVWGSIGWIAAGWILTFVRNQFGTESQPFIDIFIVAAAISVVMGFVSFALPHTPPAKQASDPLAFREAFVLLKDRNYLTFFIIAFIVATELQLYFILSAPFLKEIGTAVGTHQLAGIKISLTSGNVAAWLTLAQIAEIAVMVLLLPVVLPRLGVRKSMMIGIFAWPVRYIIFAITWPFYEQAPWLVWLSVAALTLHGFCYVFFFVVAFIYTDMVAPRDIRSSAQTLINIAILGFGLLLGSFFTGWLQELFTYPKGEEEITNYGGVFAVPAIITIICGIIFWFAFREPSHSQTKTATET